MIIIKSKDEIKKMKEAGKIIGKLFSVLKNMVKPGITTLELDSFAESFIKKNGAIPAFKGYLGYPATLCTSVNESVVHEIPSTRKLKLGDIISIDVGTFYNGYYGDAAITLPMGEISEQKKKLLQVTEEALYRGIETARVGRRLFDISNTIQTYVEISGFSVVREFIGHGIGKSLHEEPQVPNYGKAGTGPQLRAGMTIAIEPMVNTGTYKVKILKDKWRAVTVDAKPSAHFEHTIAITDGEAEILTK